MVATPDHLSPLAMARPPIPGAPRIDSGLSTLPAAVKISHIDHAAINLRELERAIERTRHPVPEPGATSSPVERVATSATAPDLGHPDAADTPADDAPSQVLKVWSPERIALLGDLYKQGTMPLDDIAARLNDLPGPPVSSAKAVKLKAWKLGLMRPALPAAPLLDPAAGEGDAPPAPAQQPPRRHGAPPHVWTPERVDALRQMYAAGAKRWTILAHINALPGPPCASVDALKMHAKKLGLTRPGTDTPASFAAAPPPAAPPPDALPTATQPARDDSDPLTWHPADDIAEARQMMRSSKVGAKALAEYFGWALAEAQAIAAALRDQIEAEARGQAA
jgi:hypothetical protein